MAISNRRHALLAGGIAAIVAAALAGIALGSHHHTYAAYSDFADVRGSAVAGVWTPDPPTACGDLSNYSKIVYGSDGDDTMVGTSGASRIVNLKHGGNREIIMGLGGDDDLSGGNGKDCIVGGAGDDVLHGDNGKDIMLGGTGDDQLLGSNAPDLLDGGPGNDLCVGGHAPDVFQNCEHAVMELAHLNQVQTGMSPSSSAPSPASSNSNPGDRAANSASESPASDSPADSSTAKVSSISDAASSTLARSDSPSS